MKFKLFPTLLVGLLLLAVPALLTVCAGHREQTGGPAPTPAAPLLAVSAPGGGPLAADGEKTVNIGVTDAPADINPLSPVGRVSAYIAGLLFPPLVEIDADLRYKPMLADSIETTDNRSFTIKLNQQARWTDGAPVTADDVIFTLKLMADAAVASNFAYMFAILEGLGPSGFLPDGETDISGVRKIDERTIEMVTKVPTTLTVFEDTIGRNLRTLPRSALKDVAPKDVNRDAFMRMPRVTSGPFKLDRYDPERSVELTANGDYFKGRPALDRLSFRVMRGTDLADRLASGEIDMNIPSAGVIPVADYARVENLPGVTTVGGQPLSASYLYINEKAVPDALQRQAISHAIDRRRIVDKLLRGAGDPADGYFNGISPYRNGSVQPAAYDPRQARSLLKATDWDVAKTLTLSVPSGDDTLARAADSVADDLTVVGMRVIVRTYDPAAVNGKLVKQDFDLCLMPATLTPVHPLPDLAYFLGAGNPNGYKNDEVEHILAQLGSEVDEAKIRALYDRLQVILAEDVPMPAVYSVKALGAVNGRVVGATPKDLGMFINVHEWKIRSGDAK
ncbi:ABC transporter substrate-binding protein [Cohnella sp. JJ-181]|uniref:ABC transporter substrate-binding protein n=1 Tax=Cohnella rhizoplanae TaxID=2974897 RepID=UPI0022FFBC9F|nr:ABC transporter substrate-binding protein [Cohnella sp. JJ-181]CAI6086431.1 Oligopeptide-binding protein AppA [Cohnella sp. JJ-181]